MQPTDSAAAGSPRLRVAQALGLVALIAGLIGALGPAEQVRTTYSWPPATLPDEAPTRSWYTPLLLITHEPESISVDVACALPPGLSGGEPGHVLSTARNPERAGGLSITQSQETLAVRLGGELLTNVALPAGGGAADCTHRVTIVDGHWFVSGGNGVDEQGLIPRMATVYGLFSGLDLGSDNALAVDVTTVPHAAEPATRQVAAWLIAAVAGATALLLVATAGRPRRRPRPTAAVGRALASAHPADAVLVVVLLAWAVIAPVNFDDGWVIQREQMFETSGGFSIYYQLLAVNMPLDYWLEWVHHWLAEASNELVVFRFAVVGVLVAVWALCRWIAGRIRADADVRLSTWTLAVVFVGGSIAWGMTIRPEPVIALALTAVTACALAFRAGRGVAPIALAAALVPLALTAHPTGTLTLAPLIVVLPALLSWAKANLPQAVTIVSASSALLATLAFVGADLDQRLDDAEVTQALSGNSREELQRYAFLWEEPFGTPIRRAFVALFLLAVVASLIRRRGGRGGLLDFPGTVLAVALVVLVVTPSKWPNHFGALIGIGALAVAAEAARLRGDARSSPGWRAFPLLAVGTATLASIWAWWEREPWNPLDLMTLDWEPGFVSRIGLTQLAVLLPSLLLGGALVWALVRGRRKDLDRVPWRVAAWIPVAMVIPTMAFTAGVLVVDAAKTSSWTLTRQNLESLTGGSGCGLADDVLVSQPSSARPARSGEREDSTPAWVPEPPVPGLPRHALGPSSEGSAFSPWFTPPSAAGAGLFVAGAPGPADTLWLEWGRTNGQGTERIGSEEITEVVAELSGNSAWRLFSAGDLPAAPPDATLMRVEYRAAVAPGTALAITSPVAYENERLAAVMSGADARTLVYPELYLYFPCRQMPALAGGTVEVPDHIVIGRTESPPLRYHVTSPFVGLLDLYELERVPVADSEARVDRLRVFEVDADIPGATLVEPTQTTS